jgi:hypothetical protein
LAGAASKGDGGFGDHAISADASCRRHHGLRGRGHRHHRACACLRGRQRDGLLGRARGLARPLSPHPELVEGRERVGVRARARRAFASEEALTRRAARATFSRREKGECRRPPHRGRTEVSRERLTRTRACPSPVIPSLSRDGRGVGVMVWREAARGLQNPSSGRLRRLPSPGGRRDAETSRLRLARYPLRSHPARPGRRLAA